MSGLKPSPLLQKQDPDQAQNSQTNIEFVRGFNFLGTICQPKTNTKPKILKQLLIQPLEVHEVWYDIIRSYCCDSFQVRTKSLLDD